MEFNQKAFETLKKLDSLGVSSKQRREIVSSCSRCFFYSKLNSDLDYLQNTSLRGDEVYQFLEKSLKSHFSQILRRNIYS
jgi:hypothetical protein